MGNHHMPRLPARIACLSGLLLIMGIANGTEQPEAPARYEVELIIFRHIDQSRNTPEIPAASSIFQPSPFDLTLAEIPLQPPVGLPDSTPLLIGAAKLERLPPISFHILELDPSYPDFVPLRQDTHMLNQVYARLERIDAYEPLLHVGWIQPARNTDSTKPYHFEPATTDGTGIAGTVTLYKERFLHLEVDLVLETEKPPARTPFFFGAGVNDSPDLYKLTESRRIRGTATHYFDSPQFGVITRIREVHAAAAEREENG
jgi:hypothetical protein